MANLSLAVTRENSTNNVSTMVQVGPDFSSQPGISKSTSAKHLYPDRSNSREHFRICYRAHMYECSSGAASKPAVSTTFGSKEGTCETRTDRHDGTPARQRRKGVRCTCAFFSTTMAINQPFLFPTGIFTLALFISLFLSWLLSTPFHGRLTHKSARVCTYPVCRIDD